jgi:hypothetical protein
VRLQRIGIWLLAAIMVSGVAIYALFMLGIITIELRPWINNGPDGHSRFFSFMDSAGISAVEESTYTDRGFAGAIYIGDPAEISGVKLRDADESALEGSPVLVLFPWYQTDELPAGLKRTSWRRFTFLDQAYYRSSDEVLSSYTLNDGRELEIEPELELIEFYGDDDGDFLIPAGSYQGYDAYLYRGINAADNRMLDSEAAFHLLYDTLADTMDEGSWVLYFEPARFGAGNRIAVAQPLKVLFSGPFLAGSLSILVVLMLGAWRAAIRFGPPRPDPVPPSRLLDGMLENTAGFWLRHAGPAAADAADLDRFWSDVLRISGGRISGRRIDELIERYPEFRERLDVLMPIDGSIAVSRVQRRIQMRNTMIANVEQQENANGTNT